MRMITSVWLTQDPPNRKLHQRGDTAYICIHQWGTSSRPLEQNSGPTDIAWSLTGEFYVSDGYINNRIARFDKDLKFLAQWGCEGIGKGQFTLPHALTIDTAGLIYVCDRTTWRVEIFSPEGTFLKQWTHIGRACDIHYMPDGHFWVFDGPTRRVTKIDRS